MVVSGLDEYEFMERRLFYHGETEEKEITEKNCVRVQILKTWPENSPLAERPGS